MAHGRRTAAAKGDHSSHLRVEVTRADLSTRDTPVKVLEAVEAIILSIGGSVCASANGKLVNGVTFTDPRHDRPPQKKTR